MRSLFRPLAVLAMTGGMVLASALPAWAHYPMLTGAQTCTAGQYVITWTVKNSETSQKMTVDQVSVTPTGTVAGLLGLYNGSETKTATTTLAGTETRTITLSVHGTWPDGVKVTRTVSVPLKGDCKPPVVIPAAPVVSGVAVCDAPASQQVVTWTVRNSEPSGGRTMTLTQISASSGTVTGLAAGSTFPAQPASGWTRTATTILPGTQTGDVTLTVKAGWSDYPGPLTGTAKVTLAGGCKPADPPPPPAPEKPVMTASAVCTSGAQIVTWMVKNPEASGGRNMTLTAVSAGSTTVTGLAVNDVLTPGSSKTGTSTLPGDRTDPVILNVTATWTGFADPLSNSVTATLGGNCVQETTTTIRTTEITSAPTTTTTTAPTTTTTAAPTTTTTVKTDVLSQTEKAPTTTTTVKTEVLGEQVTKPAPGGPLAHTGAAIGLLAFIGGGLLWIGLPLSRYKRRKNED